MRENTEVKNPNLSSKIIIGWQEWCALPELGVRAIKAKIDTGARTSALHAFNLHPFRKQGKSHLKFSLYPLQKNQQVTHECSAEVIDQRSIKNSGGQLETRYVISTLINLAGLTWPIEVTLTNRDPMRFRMLLGRAALKKLLLVDPGRICTQGKLTKKKLLGLYPLSITE